MSLIGTKRRFNDVRFRSALVQKQTVIEITIALAEVASRVAEAHGSRRPLPFLAAKNSLGYDKGPKRLICRARQCGTKKNGIWAPRGVPPAAINRLNLAIVDVLADPAVRGKLVDLGQEIAPRNRQTPEGLASLQNAEIDKWWPIIKEAGIKVE